MHYYQLRLVFLENNVIVGNAKALYRNHLSVARFRNKEGDLKAETEVGYADC